MHPVAPMAGAKGEQLWQLRGEGDEKTLMRFVWTSICAAPVTLGDTETKRMALVSK